MAAIVPQEGSQNDVMKNETKAESMMISNSIRVKRPMSLRASTGKDPSSLGSHSLSLQRQILWVWALVP
jgi:hypothetical protein